MSEQTYTIAQVAEYLQVPKARIYALVRMGHLPVVRRGRNLRVRKKDLRQWIAKQVQWSDVWFFPRL